ncbi:MAG: PilZ domain-containing protein [Pontibacterium sp.]
MTNKVERRRFTRVEFPVDSELLAVTKSYNIRLLDISLGGFMIESMDLLPIRFDETCTLSIPLGSIQLKIPARLVRQEGTHFGFHSDHLDVEMVTHLRRLIELNQDDEASFESEVEHLISEQG